VVAGRRGIHAGIGVAASVVVLAPLLLAPKCFEYQPAQMPDTGPADTGMDAPDTGPEDTGPETGLPDTTPPIDTGTPPMLSPEGMIDAACLALRCDAGDAVRYWKDDWDDHHVERIVTFRDPDASTAVFEVTDAAGAPSDLRFTSALPVTLHLVAPGDGSATGPHDLTAPELFRSIALRDVATDGGAYKGPTIDAVLPIYEAGVEHRATIRFIPIEQGTFTGWSSTGVTDGDRYAEIVLGTVTPDLGTGDAGLGMTLSVEVTADDDLTVFQGESSDRPPGLDADPRRDAADPVWGGGVVSVIGILAQEGLDPMTGESLFTFNWTTRTLAKDVGHVLELTSRPTNRFRHDFTALGMMSDSVVRAALDVDAEVRAPYFAATNINPGETIQLFIVPTIARDYQTYCQIGVTHAASGAPDLTTGHAGAGMQDEITVAP